MIWMVIIVLAQLTDPETGQIKIPPIPLMVLSGFATTEVDAKNQAVALHTLGYKVKVIGPLPIDFEL